MPTESLLHSTFALNASGYVGTEGLAGAKASYVGNAARRIQDVGSNAFNLRQFVNFMPHAV